MLPRSRRGRRLFGLALVRQIRLRSRLAFGFASLLLILGMSTPALSWVDVHVEADDAKVALDASGTARIEHKIRLKIAGGPLRSMDLRGVDKDAAPDPQGCYVVTAREA